MKCPKCGYIIRGTAIAKSLGAKGGESTSTAKARAARLNGKKGGRPKKKKEAV